MNCSMNAISELSIILWRHKLNSKFHSKALKTISGTLFLFKIKNMFLSFTEGNRQGKNDLA